MKVIPSRIGSLMKEVFANNDYILSVNVNKLDAVSSINDAGNSGDAKYTYKLFVGYNHEEECISEFFAGADVLRGGGGAAIGTSVIADSVRLGMKMPIIGSATDNASDVIKSFVKYMQVFYLRYC